MVFIRPADTAHPSCAITNSDDGHNTFHARIDRSHPNGSGPAVARAEQTESLAFDLSPLHQKSEYGLHIGNATIGR